MDENTRILLAAASVFPALARYWIDDEAIARSVIIAKKLWDEVLKKEGEQK